MRPLVFLNSVIFGGALSLGGVLGIVQFLRLMLTLDDSPDQSAVRSSLSLAELWRQTLSFAVLAGTAFCGQLFTQRWRWLAEYVLLIATVAVIIQYPCRRRPTFGKLAALDVRAAAVIFLWLVVAYLKVTRASRALQAWLIQARSGSRAVPDTQQLKFLRYFSEVSSQGRRGW